MTPFLVVCAGYLSSSAISIVWPCAWRIYVTHWTAVRTSCGCRMQTGLQSMRYMAISCGGPLRPCCASIALHDTTQIVVSSSFVSISESHGTQSQQDMWRSYWRQISDRLFQIG
ncbi:hypothetical protein LINPERPRIM_LOCUS21495, partial [Linum perenne]